MGKQGRKPGYICSDETKERLKIASTRRWAIAKATGVLPDMSHKRKKVKTPDGEFESRAACAKHYGISPATVKIRIEKTTGKYADWVYVEQVKEEQQ